MTTFQMFDKHLPIAIVTTMLRVYSRDLQICIAEGGEIENFPQIDVFAMIAKELGDDDDTLRQVASSAEVRALVLKITNQIRSGEFEPLCSNRMLTVLRSLLRFSKLLASPLSASAASA